MKRPAWATRAAPCPDEHLHTPQPASGDYLAWHAWAEEMSKTHTQNRCPGCDLWLIWVPINEENNDVTNDHPDQVAEPAADVTAPRPVQARIMHALRAPITYELMAAMAQAVESIMRLTPPTPDPGDAEAEAHEDGWRTCHHMVLTELANRLDIPTTQKGTEQ